MPLQSVFAFSPDAELRDKKQLHISQQREILEWIRRQQSPKGPGYESFWHEFTDRHLNFMATSDVGPNKFISTVPQFWLKHDYYKKGSMEDYSVIAQQDILESLDDIESSFLDAIQSENIEEISDSNMKNILGGVEESFFRAFQPQSTSSPSRPRRLPPAVAGGHSMLSSSTNLQVDASLDLHAVSEPPVLNESQFSLSYPSSLDNQVSFTVGETSRSIVWSDVKRHITDRIKSTLKKLEIETTVRIPDYMSFVRWLHPSGALGACFPLLITELKAMTVIANIEAGTKVITKTRPQVSWQAALAMKMFGETSVWTVTCAGLWACFELWDVKGMQAVPDGPLPASAKDDAAGEVSDSSPVIRIFNDTNTDFSDDYKTWMNKVLETAHMANLTDRRRSGVGH